MKLLPPAGAALLLFLFGFTGIMPSARAAEAASLGSPDFKLSPERPVGWRGDGTGHFPGATPPTSWERTRGGAGYESKGFIWVTPLPAGGISSAIVVGQRVFVTTEGADLVCVDKATGKLLWIHSHPEFLALSEEDRKANPAFAETLAPLAAQLEQANLAVIAELNAQPANAAPTRPPASVEKKKALEKQIQDQLNSIDKKRFDHSWPQGVYGYCTETPASDGHFVYVYFATGVSVCYDLEGNRKWIAHGPSGGEEKGNYTSPLLMDGQFIVWGGPEMRAYDAKTGKMLWSQVVKGANPSSLYGLHSGRDNVAAFRNFFVRIRDGKAIWNSKNTDTSPQTPIIAGDSILTWTGNPGAFKALKIPADTESGEPAPVVTFKTDWGETDLPKTKERPFDREIIDSPLFVDGLVYRICSGGALMVNDASTGEVLYHKLLPMKPRTQYWAYGGAAISPALAGKHIYLMDNQGTTVIIEPGREYKEVAVNHIEEFRDGKEQVQNLSNPFFEGTRMYYRTPGYLYCIGEK